MLEVTLVVLSDSVWFGAGCWFALEGMLLVGLVGSIFLLYTLKMDGFLYVDVDALAFWSCFTGQPSGGVLCWTGQPPPPAGAADAGTEAGAGGAGLEAVPPIV
jgi:hypothetical protein